MRVHEKQLFKKARSLAAKVPLVRHVVAMWNAFKDPATPVPIKATILLAIAYFVLPFDVIPDMIAGLGYTDDAAVIFAALKAVGSMVNETHYQGADSLLAEWRSPEVPRVN